MYLNMYMILVMAMYLITVLPKHMYMFLLFFILQVLGLFLALDTNMTDYPNYMQHWNDVPVFYEIFDYKVYGEIGFVFFQSIIKTLGFNYVEFRIIYFIILMALTYLLVFNTDKLLSITVFFWFFAYFYHNEGNIIRHAMASILVILSYVYFLKSKIRLSILFLLIAPLFHTSSIVAIFPYIIYALKPKKFFFLIVLIFAFLIGIYGIKETIIELLSLLLQIDIWIVNKLFRYFINEDAEIGGLVRSIIFVPLVLISLGIIKFDKVYNNKSTYLWFIVLFTSLILLIIFSELRIVADRMYTLLGISGGFFLYYSKNLFDKEFRILYLICWFVLIYSFTIFKYSEYSWKITL